MTERPYEYSIGPGWKLLVDPLIFMCEANGGRIFQIKEKFGGLRFYYDEPDQEAQTPKQRAFWKEFSGLVSDAEAQSYCVCERTGKPGRLYSTRVDGSSGWMRTLSPEVAYELGYEVGPVDEKET